jgi:hypothetical protein
MTYTQGIGLWLAAIVLILRWFYCASPRRED